MSVREHIEYQKSTKRAIQKYENVFGKDSFPMFYFEAEFRHDELEKNIVETINKCLSNKKDVYDMEIVPLSAFETCY